MKKDFSEFKRFIKDKNVAVVGIGVSNIPLIEFLIDLGAKVTAFDKKNIEKLKEVVDKYQCKGVKFELGEEYLSNLHGFDVIFKTPSMRIDGKELTIAKNEGAYITSEMEEFVRYCPAKVYGITGSDGKTTTTSLVYSILSAAGFKTWVGGNIGTPLFTKIEEISPEDKVVLELSSFQLMTMDTSPEVALITNLSPNHLDMHKDLQEYIDSKKNIFKYQNKHNLLVLNEDNDVTRNIKGEEKGRLYTFSRNNVIKDGAYYKDGDLFAKGKKVCNKSEVLLKGMYNIENLLAAFALIADGVDVKYMREVATTFKGVEHRNEFVRNYRDVEYYNNSIASSPTRTLAGIKAFEKPVVLIAGGRDKKVPFDPLAYEGYPYIKSLILLGEAKDQIKKVFDKLKSEKGIDIDVHIVNTLEEAVNKAMEISVSGDIVTLAPACTSFDMFENFEVRGNKFKEVVKNLK
ncbi:UDP-N-acetylmuramoyl-L-alanine--D-glutamate ligase [uncultured Clostridium sp.]|uniref:UDP-N-acetylmuramoyl-L-alanine--D-glutamate ligase n=1 Tax=uncultured Clostridium sp. TaxID=59620 RepID=UPI003216B9E2